MNTTDIRLHRFQKYLAISLDSSVTEYVTVEQAEELKQQLQLFIDDVNKNKFHQSEFKTVTIYLKG